MILFYWAVLERRDRMSAWSGNVTAQLKNKLACLVQTSMKAMGEKNQSLQSTYEQSVVRHAQKILFDPPHNYPQRV